MVHAHNHPYETCFMMLGFWGTPIYVLIYVMNCFNNNLPRSSIVRKQHHSLDYICFSYCIPIIIPIVDCEIPLNHHGCCLNMIYPHRIPRKITKIWSVKLTFWNQKPPWLFLNSTMKYMKSLSLSLFFQVKSHAEYVSWDPIILWSSQVLSGT